MSPETARTLVIVLLVPFTLLTAVAIWVEGLTGFPAAITYNWSATQIYVDLVLAILVISVWIHRDARSRGRNPWPWIVASFVVGMFSPLAYLLTRPAND